MKRFALLAEFAFAILFFLSPHLSHAEWVVDRNIITNDSEGGIAVNPTTNRIYAIGRNDHDYPWLTVIDGTNDSILTQLSGGAPPFGTRYYSTIALNSVTNRIYLGTSDLVVGTNDACGLALLNGATNSIEIVDLKAITLPLWDPFYFCEGRGVAVNPTTNRVYIAQDYSLLILDGATHSYIDWIDTATGHILDGNKAGKNFLIPMALNSATNRIYLAGHREFQSGFVLTVVDGTTNTILAHIPLPFIPAEIAINPETNRIYMSEASNGGNDHVLVLDGATNSIIEQINLNFAPAHYITGLAVDPTTNRIYVAHGGLQVIDGATHSVLEEITLDLGQSDYTGGLAINTITNRIYASNYRISPDGPPPFGITVLVEASNVTPAGTDVAVLPIDSTTGTAPVTLTFSSVSQAGDTTVASSTSGPPPMSGFQVGDPAIFYDISTTASISGNIALCFSWTEGQFDNENNVALFHYENGAWQNKTTSLDTNANKVCGQTTSLSPFALFERTPYAFTGFFSPVDNSPVRNQVKAGSAVPVKFSLNGNQGLAIFASGYPGSQQVQCDTSAPLDAIEETVSAAGSSLSYHASSDRYTYIWKTNKAWANSCRQLVLRFNDGSVKTADFTFK